MPDKPVFLYVIVPGRCQEATAYAGELMRQQEHSPQQIGRASCRERV